MKQLEWEDGRHGTARAVTPLIVYTIELDKVGYSASRWTGKGMAQVGKGNPEALKKACQKDMEQLVKYYVSN